MYRPRVLLVLPTALCRPQGLGKTIEVLGLILSNPAPPSVISGRFDPESRMIVSRGTLVVCAVSLVGQVGVDLGFQGCLIQTCSMCAAGMDICMHHASL
jgi:hypothetical protein